MTTARQRDPIRKISKSGQTKYRFVIDVGKRPDGGRDQRTYTCDKYAEAKAKRAEIIADRRDETLVKPDQRGLDTIRTRRSRGPRLNPSALRAIPEGSARRPRRSSDR
jgi:hypothetical protein